MSQIHWINPVDGNFDTPADWSGGVVPGGHDSAILDAAGPAFQVTSSGNETVNSIKLAANATLDITGGTFQAKNATGAGAGANAGSILVSGGSLLFGGLGQQITTVNTGLIEASQQGIVEIAGSAIKGRSGEVAALTGGVFYLDGCTISGQTFSTEARSNIEFQGDTVTAGGPIQNAGEIYVETTTMVLNKNTTLSGGGELDLTSGNITGKNLSKTLVNVDNTINAFLNGSNDLGGGSLTIINEAGGTIETGNGCVLVIDTGRKTIMNAGLIESDVPLRGLTGGVTLIETAIENDGVLSANGKRFTLAKAVTGSGHATLGGGALIFRSSFSQDVTFTGTTGVLQLDESQSYGGSISGFSKSGGTSLDLRDIEFVSASEASFRGTLTSGVLTVSDGSHTARISLVGDYLGSTFTCSSDHHGGVEIVASASDSATRDSTKSLSTHAMVSAIAALAPDHAALSAPHEEVLSSAPPMLLTPRTQVA